MTVPVLGFPALPRARALPTSLLLMAFFAMNAGGCDYTDYTVPGYNKGYKPVQPISFSHKLHAGELQMDCKYCHFGAEKGKKAGVPPVSVCLNCHKQIRPDAPEIKKIHAAAASGQSIPWVKVHNLPDFVTFDHSRHVNKGVACQTCHGPVQEMVEVKQFSSLAMGWCVNCHRSYNTDPPEQLKDRKIHASIDCTGCHQ